MLNDFVVRSGAFYVGKVKEKKKKGRETSRYQISGGSHNLLARKGP